MDAESFEDFYTSGYGALVGALALVTGSREEARDAVDEALTRAWIATRRGRAPDSLPAWVRVVAFNVARGGLRRRRLDERARARLAVAVGHARAAEVPVTAAVDVQRALARLTRRQREVTVLHYLCDIPVREIAQDLGIDEGTVKTLLHRARAVLADVLRDTDDEPAATTAVTQGEEMDRAH